ncbi:hypothetical protein [Aureimonas jatrophae]|nr:hypothetical protein [Aureimonas jatrophae]
MLSADVWPALVGARFAVFSLPFFWLESGRLLCVAVFVCLCEPDGGLVWPLGFVVLVAAADLLVPFGVWVLFTALREFVGLPGVLVVVDVLRVQFVDLELVVLLFFLVSVLGLKGVRLEVALSSVVLLLDVVRALDTLLRLGALVVRIGLSAFGIF